MADESPPSSRPLPDLIAGRYRIAARLGVGGMGIVYKAIDQQLNRPVAVKALEDRRLHLPGAAARLRTEAMAAASLDHPYICKVYELVESGSETFIIMEFIEGETLASMLKRGVLPLPQLLQLGREVAEGLADAHAHGLVHRDVKPSNVMVTLHGHVKLLDFGVAGADVASTPSGDTRTLAPHLTIHAGTPQYMAPEQAAGQPITTRADLFSLGVVLYECLTGQLPFSGSSTFDYVRHVMQSPPRRLDRLAPDTPADLVDLINRCLEKVPADRPESADAVVTELRRLQDALTGPTGGVRTAQQAQAGRRWKLVAVAAVVIAAIASSWRVLWPGSANETPRQSRPFVTTSATESNSQISPDAQWISFISTEAGVTRILVQRVDGGEARPLTLGPGEPISQIWSPDGTQLAAIVVLDGQRLLQVYPAFFGGEPIVTVPLPNLDAVDLVRWIDRDVYFRASLRGVAGTTLRRISLDSPDALTIVSDGWKLDGTLRSADVRPNGREAVIVVSRNSQEDLWTLNLDGSALRQLTNDAYFDRGPRWVGQRDRVVFQSNRGGQVDLWEIDVRTKALTALTSGDADEIADSTSPDGTIISFQQLTKDANLWTFSGAPQQLTQDSLSDHSPILSGDGRMLAFQRSQPTPSQGFTILDAKIFVSPFQGGPVINARSIADGFAPDLSHDGQWLAYLQNGDRAPRMVLTVRDLRGGGSVALSRSTTPPALTLVPVEWASRVTAWSPDGLHLYFVDWPDEVMAIRRFRVGDEAPGPPLFTAATDRFNLRDLYVSPASGRLAYIASSPVGVTVHELDPADGTVREVASFTGAARGHGLAGRGWLGQSFVLLRSGPLHENHTVDLDVLVTDGRGGARIAGRITNAFTATARLHAQARTLYVTRAEKGAHNVYAFSFDTGAVTAVTTNALPGVTFSGFQPLGAQGLFGVREERRDVIWIIQETAAPRSGNQAGR